ncbi:DNA-directed RNA polymerase, subunit P [Candidatus Nanobsidianus stetteri]|uniref:DNA-directed RNA polymerase subunit Rpo12 n=1 Tax=Nanobsidianus stetteri TaxID=1294122 RepID=R1FU14_NANST|nr:DNA-directed RNA polymerase, subunit P [Candidatus Nanobsidianus stetteri]
MTQYICINCKRIIDGETALKKVKCIYCGSKILVKLRSNTIKKIKAV